MLLPTQVAQLADTRRQLVLGSFELPIECLALGCELLPLVGYRQQTV